MQRIVGVATIAIATALLLTGCSVWESGERAVTDVVEAAVAHQKLGKLTDDLRQRDDVSSAEFTVTPIERTSSVTVVLEVSASPDSLADVAGRVDEVLRQAELAPFERLLSVQLGDSRIEQSSFDLLPVDFSADVAYWGELQSTLGVELGFELHISKSDGVVRILSASADESIVSLADNYDRVLAVPPPNAETTLWRLPGVTGSGDGYGPLPEHRMLALLAEAGGVTNLLNASAAEEPPGLFAYLPEALPPRFTLVANAPGSVANADAATALAVSVAELVVARSLPAFQFSVQTYTPDAVDTASFHVGGCEKPAPPTQADQFLLDSLRAAELSVLATAGGCLSFEPSN